MKHIKRPNIFAPLLLIGVFIPLLSEAQTEFKVTVPAKNYSAITVSSDLSGIEDLINEFNKYSNLYNSILCLDTLNPEIKKQLEKEMAKINNGTAYTLTVDYISCKFISLLPDNGAGLISHPDWTTYYISLYQKIPIEPVIKSDEKDDSKTPLLATYLDDSGKWIAMGPYLTSDAFNTENEAIGSLFYSSSDMRFLCQKGKFKIYALNMKVDHYYIDVRNALKQLGITDIPE